MKKIKQKKYSDREIEEIKTAFFKKFETEINNHILYSDEKVSVDIPFWEIAFEDIFKKENIDKYSELFEYIFSMKDYDMSVEDFDKDGGFIISLYARTESQFEMETFEDYTYLIECYIEDRWRGYCNCSPEDEDYDERYKCCGHSCDYYAPMFAWYKKVTKGLYSYDGDAHDIWDYRDKYMEAHRSDEQEAEKILNKISQKESLIANAQEEIKKLQAELSKFKKE